VTNKSSKSKDIGKMEKNLRVLKLITSKFAGAGTCANTRSDVKNM